MVVSLFNGLLFDTRISKLNETSIQQLLQRNQRMIIYVSANDTNEFTNDSPFSMDGCNIDNHLGDYLPNVTKMVDQYLLGTFEHANKIIENDKKQNKFFLMSLAASAPVPQILYSAIITYYPYYDEDYYAHLCAEVFNIPGMSDWCPMHLLDLSQLTNYYNQIALDAVITRNLYFPNAFYLDALEPNGLIRTGNLLLQVNDDNNNNNDNNNDNNYINNKRDDHGTTAYCYVDTVLLYNLIQGCQAFSIKPNICVTLRQFIEARRALNPLQLWNDPEYGRLQNWPPITH